MTEMMKTLWASVQGDPVFMRRVNGWLTLLWIVMIPISIATGWINSVAYVASLSLWALVSGHWSAWQAARVEVNKTRRPRSDAPTPRESIACVRIRRHSVR
jgi:hypothetical protein